MRNRLGKSSDTSLPPTLAIQPAGAHRFNQSTGGGDLAQRYDPADFQNSQQISHVLNRHNKLAIEKSEEVAAGNWTQNGTPCPSHGVAGQALAWHWQYVLHAAVLMHRAHLLPKGCRENGPTPPPLNPVIIQLPEAMWCENVPHPCSAPVPKRSAKMG